MAALATSMARCWEDSSWVLYTWLYPKFRDRFNRKLLLASLAFLSIAAGVYAGFLVSQTFSLNRAISPVAGVLVAAMVCWLLHLAVGRPRLLSLRMALAAAAALVLGVYIGLLLAVTPGANLYLSWLVGTALAGATGLAH